MTTTQNKKFNDMFFPGLPGAERIECGLPLIAFPKQYATAVMILDNDFISPMEIAMKYGFGYTPEKLKQFAETLPDIKTLWWLRQNGYVLIAGPATDMNLISLNKLDPVRFFAQEKGWFRRTSWQHNSYAETEVVHTDEWLMLKKVNVPYLESVDDSETTLVTYPERVASAVEVCYGLMVYWDLRQLHLVSRTPILTTSKSDGGVLIRINIEYSGPNPPPYAWRDRGNLSIARARVISQEKS